MSGITATVVSQPITASVSNAGGISANVGASSVSVTASGGIGPQGASGAAGGTLDQLSNVQISGAVDGDVLRYSGSKWRNHPEGDLILDGQNF
jgi:hypothetical protein